MGRERIYASYRVEVENLDGSKQEFTFDSIDTSYKDMLDRYREIKDKFSDDKDVYCITFIGVKKDGSMKAVYPPKIVNSKENKEESKTPFDEINNILESLRQYKDLYRNYEIYYSKKLDELLHDVEASRFVSNEKLNDYKIKIFDSLFELRDNRRITKDRNTIANKVFKDNKLNLENINELNELWNRHDNFTKDDINKNVKCNVISYLNERDCQEIINNLRFKGYDNIYKLPENKICYFQYLKNRTIEENINLKNKVEELKSCVDNVYSSELDLMLNAVSTISCGKKIEKKKGSSIQVKCKTEGQIRKTIEDNKDKYEKCIFIKDKNIVRLINRIA